jgi:hypothetical protein
VAILISPPFSDSRVACGGWVKEADQVAMPVAAFTSTCSSRAGNSTPSGISGVTARTVTVSPGP